MTVGERIRSLREDINVSQTELSKKIKINNSVLSRIEKNERAIRDEELNKIADFFDVSVDYILGRTHIKNYNDILASHTDDDMNEEAKAELENFKDYLRAKYKNE